MEKTVESVYLGIVESVICSAREHFLNANVDESVLDELKHLWDSKLFASKALPSKNSATDLVEQIQSHSLSTRSLSQNIAGGSSFPTSADNGPVFLGHRGLDLANQHPTLALPPQLFQQQMQNLQQGGAITLQTGPGMTTQLVLASSVMQRQSSQGRDDINGVVQVDGAGDDLQERVGLAAKPCSMPQVDGRHDSSSSDGDDDEDDDDGDDDDDDEQDDGSKNEEPLCSEDDISDEDTDKLFSSDDVIVCQFDRINRTKNKWKLNLKDGIVNINGKDYVFQKATGEAEW